MNVILECDVGINIYRFKYKLKYFDIFHSVKKFSGSINVFFSLVYFVKNFFPHILDMYIFLNRVQDSSDVVNVVRTIVEIFGPRTIVSHLFTSSGHYRSPLSDEGDDKVMTDFFLDLFKEDFVPLCLQKYTRSSSSRLDLLISLLDEEIFSQQWLLIMLHARKLEQYPGSDHVRVLAMLMGKLREKIGNRTPGFKLQHIGIDSKCWQHDFLNSVAASIACQRPPFSKSDVSFLW